jgi:hypothetical protein
MALTFYPPSARASSSDLTVAISPLGLTELSDEEFEVHGPRMTRYSTHAAWYLGHHWAYRREVGEPQFAFNYTRALSDYMVNFSFGKGVHFRTPQANAAVIPTALKRVWEQDNSKERLLWEMGNLGSVYGDVFVKVAYEDPWVDPAGRLHNGRVRIIPLNPSWVFPEWHPHDRSRMVRVKIKYRFWGTDQSGTRTVHTYTEILTEAEIQEYVDNTLLDARPNPLGTIPVVHIPNLLVPGSPWGLSDISDVIPLNREYNEKALEVSDIVNYYSAPVTVIVGAKASNLERGARKTWAIPNKDARVENLAAIDDLAGPLAYLQVVKKGMHEMTGVPEGALGQSQPISNTSGVALHIQYQPLMNRDLQKKITFTPGLQKINELAILTLAHREPQMLMWDPYESPAMPSGSLPQLDPTNPNTYETSVHWPPPLPVDLLVKLNEIQTKMALGLESKRGALQDLGEEFPDAKMAEIFAELVVDRKDQGALDLVSATIQAAIMAETGMTPDGAPASSVNSAGGSDVSSPEAGGPLPGAVVPGGPVDNMVNEIVTRAFGGRLAQNRNPENDV